MDSRVYLVTDDPSRYAGDWLENVEAAIAGGVTCVQFRDAESNGKTQYYRALALKDLLSRLHVPLVVNNDAALALAVGADGIHVGQSDLPPDAVRRVVGPKMDVGFSVTSLSQANARLLGWLRDGTVNRVGIGPVWDATKTKRDAAPEMGVDGFKEILEALDFAPNVAIGGVTPERSPALVRAGAGGLAVVSAFSRSANPCAVAKKFRSLF